MLLEFGSNQRFKRNLFESKINFRQNFHVWDNPDVGFFGPHFCEKTEFQSQNQSPPLKTKMKHVQTLCFFLGGIWQVNMC